MKLTVLALRNIRRNRKRSMLSISATAIATFGIMFMFAYIEGVKKDMKDVSFNYDTGEVQIRNREYDDKIVSLDKAVDNYKEVIKVVEREYPELELSPRLRFPSRVLDGDETYSCFGIAVDFEREREYLKLDNKIVEGRLPEKPREVLMGYGLADELGLNIGDKFTPLTLTRKGATSGITFKISGMADFNNGAFKNKTFMAPLTDVPMILRMPGAVSEILIKNTGNENWEESADSITDLLEGMGFDKLEALPWTKVGIGYEMLKAGDYAYSIMAVFFFILSSTVIANTMLMVVFERRKEIGTIAAMGMTENEIVLLFFIEAFYLGFIGALAGEILGLIIIVPLSVLGMDLTSYGTDVDFGISWYIYPQLTIKSTLLVFFYSIFIASIISLFPSRGAAKIDPVKALRTV